MNIWITFFHVFPQFEMLLGKMEPDGTRRVRKIQMILISVDVEFLCILRFSLQFYILFSFFTSFLFIFLLQTYCKILYNYILYKSISSHLHIIVNTSYTMMYLPMSDILSWSDSPDLFFIGVLLKRGTENGTENG